MASGVKVTLHLSGVRKALNEPGVVEDCVRRCKAIADAANDDAPKHGYKEREPFAAEEGKTGRGNKCGVAYTRTDLGKRMQAKHDTLTQAMDAGRR